MSGTPAPAVFIPSAHSAPAPSTHSADAAPAAGTRLLGLPLGIVLQSVVAAGDGLAMVALANRVFQTSQASWAVAAVFLAVCVPISALSPLAGLLLDRLPTKPVLVIAGAVESLIALALVWATSLTATLILATGFGVCAAVLQPGLGAIVPRLTSATGVTKANSYLQAATWAGFTVGPLLAGLLITASGSGLALAANAVLYGLGTAGLAALRLAPRTGGSDAGPASGSSLGSQLRAGFSFLRSDADAGMLVLIIGLMTAFTNMAVVAEVVFAERVLHSGPAGYSLLVAGWTAGMVAGTLAGGRLRSRWLLAAALAGTVLTGLGVALAGAAAVLGQAVVAYAAGGLANGFEAVATRSYLGNRTPAHLSGRVFAVYSGVVFGGISAGMAAAAGLLSALGARAVLVISGSGGIAVGIAGCVLYLARQRAARRILAEIQDDPADLARSGPDGAARPPAGSAPLPRPAAELAASTARGAAAAGPDII